MARARATNLPWASAMRRSRAVPSPSPSRSNSSLTSVVWPMLSPLIPPGQVGDRAILSLLPEPGSPETARAPAFRPIGPNSWPDPVHLGLPLPHSPPDRGADERRSPRSLGIEVTNRQRERTWIMAREISQSEFDSEVIDSSVPVLLDLYGEHCGPCRQLAPMMDRL